MASELPSAPQQCTWPQAFCSVQSGAVALEQGWHPQSQPNMAKSARDVMGVPPGLELSGTCKESSLVRLYTQVSFWTISFFVSFWLFWQFNFLHLSCGLPFFLCSSTKRAQLACE